MSAFVPAKATPRAERVIRALSGPKPLTTWELFRAVGTVAHRSITEAHRALPINRVLVQRQLRGPRKGMERWIVRAEDLDRLMADGWLPYGI